MRRLKISLFILIILFSSKAYSQFFREPFYYDSELYYEVGLGLGGMNCITDVGGANTEVRYYLNEIKVKNFRFNGSIYGSIVYRNFLGAKLEISRGQVRSGDYDIKGNSIYAQYKRNRNLSFKSDITEIALLFDFRPLALYDLEPKTWAPETYALAGIGWFSFNPRTLYDGRWVDLKPLRTEGEGFPEYPLVSQYKLSQVNVPVGIGIRYKLSPRLNLRLEYIHRILFTDYLDDASSEKFIDPDLFDKYLSPAAAADARVLYNRTINGRTPPRRGNPSNNDAYMSLTVKLGVALGTEK